MPALDYKPDHLLAARATFGSSESRSIETTEIVLIVFLAIVPMFIVAGVVIWALGCYGRRGRKNKGPRKRAKSQSDNETTTSTTNDSIYSEKSYDIPLPAPSRPSLAHTRPDYTLQKQYSDENPPTSPRGFV